MINMLKVIGFYSLVCALTICSTVSRANCVHTMGELEFQWNGHEVARQMNLPLKDITVNGVAHVQLPPRLIEALATSKKLKSEPQDEEELKTNEKILAALKEVGFIVAKQLAEELPEFEVVESDVPHMAPSYSRAHVNVIETDIALNW